MEEKDKKKRWRPSLTAYRALERVITELREKNATLEASNGFMEKELNRVRELNRSLEKMKNALNDELHVLKSRGFWARVFNKFI